MFHIRYKCCILKGLCWKRPCPEAPCRASRSLKLVGISQQGAPAPQAARSTGGVIQVTPLYPMGKKLLVTQNLGAWLLIFISSHVPGFPLILLASITVPSGVGEYFVAFQIHTLHLVSATSASVQAASSQVPSLSPGLSSCSPPIPPTLHCCDPPPPKHHLWGPVPSRGKGRSAYLGIPV